MTISLVLSSVETKKQKTAVLSDISDIKDFKKILRTKTNVLVLFVNEMKKAHNMVEVFKETADTMRGQATLILIDCNNR